MILQSIPASSGWRLFKIQGQLDIASAPPVQAALQHVAERESANLLIDLEDVGTVDDVGVSALVSAVRRIVESKQSVRVVFVARSPLLANALSHSGFSAIYSDGDQALRAIGLQAA